jgi:hypothetical protein
MLLVFEEMKKETVFQAKWDKKCMYALAINELDLKIAKNSCRQCVIFSKVWQIFRQNINEKADLLVIV